MSLEFIFDEDFYLNFSIYKKEQEEEKMQVKLQNDKNKLKEKNYNTDIYLNYLRSYLFNIYYFSKLKHYENILKTTLKRNEVFLSKIDQIYSGNKEEIKEKYSTIKSTKCKDVQKRILNLISLKEKTYIDHIYIESITKELKTCYEKI